MNIKLPSPDMKPEYSSSNFKYLNPLFITHPSSKMNGLSGIGGLDYWTRKLDWNVGMA